MTDITFTPSELTKYIHKKLNQDKYLNSFQLTGEISNHSSPPSGHHYFVIKDDESLIRCVLFRGGVGQENLKDGNEVVAKGKMSIYQPKGEIQFIAESVEVKGEGSLQQKFEKLKAELEAQGLFDQSRKRDIPKMPKTVGIVTSKTGSVLQDIINVIERRYPNLKLIISDTRVQGDNASNSIVESISSMNKLDNIDVIILARGGGSIEDLWPFNEETVARAIFSCPIPIISAVGHETDLSISDLVADMRAPTPSAAAELVSPATNDIFDNFIGFERNLSSLMKRYLQIRWQSIDNIKDRFALQEPSRLLQKHNDRYNELTKLLFQAYRFNIQTFSSKFLTLHEKLHALNPTNILSRGYSIAYREDDQKIILDPDDLQQNEYFKLQTFKGALRAKKTDEKK